MAAAVANPTGPARMIATSSMVPWAHSGADTAALTRTRPPQESALKGLKNGLYLPVDRVLAVEWTK